MTDEDEVRLSSPRRSSERRFVSGSGVKNDFGSWRPGIIVSESAVLRTSPATRTRSDSRQNATWPSECPGTSSTVKLPTLSPSRSLRSTGWPGPVQVLTKNCEIG